MAGSFESGKQIPVLRILVVSDWTKNHNHRISSYMAFPFVLRWPHTIAQAGHAFPSPENQAALSVIESFSRSLKGYMLRLWVLVRTSVQRELIGYFIKVLIWCWKQVGTHTEYNSAEYWMINLGGIFSRGFMLEPLTQMGAGVELSSRALGLLLCHQTASLIFVAKGKRRSSSSFLEWVIPPHRAS